MSAKPADPTGLALLREPFPAHQIGWLPKPTKAQTEAVRADFRAGARCNLCGTWHHPQVQHLDYVGHAALTDRLLDADPEWAWEPLAYGPDGLPRLDAEGGLWIKLTVCGVTRLGYGDAQGKTGGDAMKEKIGDALRNAGLRFGAALELWHKGDLHVADAEAEDAPPQKAEPEPLPEYPQELFDANLPKWHSAIQSGVTTPANKIAQITTKYRLTQAQIDQINGIQTGGSDASAQ